MEGGRGFEGGPPVGVCVCVCACETAHGAGCRRSFHASAALNQLVGLMCRAAVSIFCSPPPGDTVSNADLRPILAAHRERAERDKDAIMTLVGGRRRGGDWWGV